MLEEEGIVNVMYSPASTMNGHTGREVVEIDLQRAKGLQKRAVKDERII